MNKKISIAQRRGARSPVPGLTLMVLALMVAGAVLTGRPGQSQATALAPNQSPVGSAAAYTLSLPLIHRYYDGSVMHYGVQIIGSPLSTSADRAHQAGIQWTRVLVQWQYIEPTNVSPAAYNWSAYDSTLLTLVNAGLRPIITISGNPGWAASTTCGPISPTHVVDFQEFVGALVARYSQYPYRVTYWEFYNEPDNTDPVNYAWLAGCWGGHGAEYVAMLQAMYPVVKAANPQAQVTLGGLAYDNFTETGGPFERQFLDTVLAAGGANYFDVMNFHYYHDYAYVWEAERPGEKGIIAKANYLRARLAGYGVTKPFICTETSMLSDGVDGEIFQSRYVPQTFARGLAADLDVIIWYCMADYDTQYLYGLLNQDLSRKLAYRAYQTLTTEVHHARFVRKLSISDTGNDNIEGYEFENPVTGKRQGVLWTNTVPDTSYPMRFPVSAPGGAIRWVPKIAYDVNGQPTGIQHIVYDGGSGDLDGMVNSEVVIWIGPEPIYVAAYP
ncbi:MAG: cellulase family glycosylhydrolase [Chloroflexi bacterium]|nr:cellulase family glycosylhydrolase [Chloroflexota bacterium]MBU1750014.1 cellulase family glycosylhydrolase [Chloroflexota bacterium]